MYQNFCVLIYAEFLSVLYKKFQVVAIYDTNVAYQIWCFYCNLFLSYGDYRHTDQKLKMWFSDSEGLIMCKSIKISISKIRPKNNTFSNCFPTITWVRESKNYFEGYFKDAYNIIMCNKIQYLSLTLQGCTMSKHTTIYFVINFCKTNVLKCL